MRNVNQGTRAPALNGVVRVPRTTSHDYAPQNRHLCHKKYMFDFAQPQDTHSSSSAKREAINSRFDRPRLKKARCSCSRALLAARRSPPAANEASRRTVTTMVVSADRGSVDGLHQLGAHRGHPGVVVEFDDAGHITSRQRSTREVAQTAAAQDCRSSMTRSSPARGTCGLRYETQPRRLAPSWLS